MIFVLQINDLDIVKALVVFDAEVNCLDFQEWSPMDHAIVNRNQVSGHFIQEIYDTVSYFSTLLSILKGTSCFNTTPLSLYQHLIHATCSATIPTALTYKALAILMEEESSC